MSVKNEIDTWICGPLDTYEEVLHFHANIPAWRSLCTDLKPSSRFAIKNQDFDGEIKPIRGNTQCLESSKAFCHFNPESDEPKRYELKNLPKTLVCHDMANGYHDDSYIEGTADHDAYTFYNWSGIDIFCYFSHYLVTIPPLAWINVAHDHGVKVIGTLITEWANGAQFWEKLSTEESYRQFADALVLIAKTMKFDGWLLNIENKVHHPAILLQFVQYFHSSLHLELPHPVLIWYDSVTTDGTLYWQNGLSEKNKDFFDACDGIFTNYSWTEKHIEDSVAHAGDRLTDVYVGIDVWGRNFYGGGQFNIQQAVRVAHQHGCSLAIFAPAWTHEAMELDDKSGLEAYDLFLLRDRALWGSIWPYLNTRLPTKLPFQTSFCRGQGKKRRLYGEVLCPGPWYNLRHQQYQPNASHGPHGYILSTIQRLIQKWHSAKNEMGIIRYRSSFIDHQSKPESTASPSPSVSLQTESTTNSLKNTEPAPIVEDHSEAHQSGLVEKFKHWIHIKKKLFGLSSENTRYASPTAIDQDLSRTQETPSLTSVTTPSSRSKDSYPSVVKLSSGINLDFGKSLDKKRYALAAVPDEFECTEVYQEDSFIGGSCLRIHPSDPVTPEHRFIRLFHCDFHIQKALVVCVVTKLWKRNQYLDMELRLLDKKGAIRKIVLRGSMLENPDVASSSKDGAVYPLTKQSKIFRHIQRYLMIQESACYVPVENAYQWDVRYYVVSCPGHDVTSINCRTEFPDGSILLGYLGLFPMTEDLVEDNAQF